MRSLGIRDQIGRAQQGFESSRISPPAVEIRECHGAFPDVGVVDIGDLQLPAVVEASATALRLKLLMPRASVEVAQGKSN